MTNPEGTLKFSGNRTPMIVVMSGPSGVGKDAILERMAELKYPYHFVITATTRDPRPGEVDGVNHYFVDRTRFQELIDSDELLEHAEVYVFVVIKRSGHGWDDAVERLHRALDLSKG